MFIAALGLERPHVLGLSWGGGLALELYRGHPTVPRTLTLVSAYAGWAGSLPDDIVKERLQLMLRNSELPPDKWPETYFQTLVAAGATSAMTAELRSILSDFHPVGTRAAMRAFADADLRPVLPRLDVPTLLVYGDQDVRAPREVWEPLHAAIPNSKLVVIPGVGHMIDIEAADRLNAEFVAFVRSIESKPD